MKLLYSFLLVLFLLAACVPSGRNGQPAPSETPQPQMTLPTIVLVQPTETIVPTATTAPSPTPDKRVIKVDPQDLLLDLNDLPFVGNYFIPNKGLSPLRNSEIIHSLRVEKGEEYINETGRIDGWTVLYVRGVKTQPLPKEVADTVVLYETIDGAQLAIEKYWDLNRSPDFRKILAPPTVGDVSLALSRTKNDNVEYLYFFSYRNCVHTLEVRGSESDVTLKFVEKLATDLLVKMVNAQFLE